jgi:hypothetical protein
MSPIETPVKDECLELSQQESLRHEALTKKTRYCNAQNEILAENGYPSCNRNECFEQINLGNSKDYPVELSLTNLPRRSNFFLKFTIYFSPKTPGKSIRCNDISLKGPFSLDQLEQLRDYMDYLEKLNKCGLSN